MVALIGARLKNIFRCRHKKHLPDCFKGIKTTLSQVMKNGSMNLGVARSQF
jgi:hypothetical protein